MENEMKHYGVTYGNLKLIVKDLELKLKGQHREQISTKETILLQVNEMKSFKDDLYECLNSHLNDYKKLKRGIVRLHKVYVQDEGTESKQSDDQHSKLKNNRESMEKNLQFMRESLKKDQRTHKTDTLRLMKDNV